MVSTVTYKITNNTNGIKDLLKACEVLKQKVRVGYFSGNKSLEKAVANHEGGVGQYADGDYVDIPRRPFLSHAMDTYGEEIFKNVGAVLEEGFTEKNAKEALKEAGKNGINITKFSIDTVKDWSRYPHNSKKTISYKGFDQPLFETGEMKESVEFKIVR